MSEGFLPSDLIFFLKCGLCKMIMWHQKYHDTVKDWTKKLVRDNFCDPEYHMQVYDQNAYLGQLHVPN
jgi:hypothetical protein